MEPEPQDLEQTEYADHAVKLQSTGHGPREQLRFSTRSVGHGVPVIGAVWATTVRVRSCMPLGPQVTEQEPQSAQSVTWQSFGQAWVLHSWFWTFSVQALPPNWGWATERLRFCEPPAPHDLVQVDHAANDDTTQCTAHACALQPRVSSRYGHT